MTKAEKIPFAPKVKAKLVQMLECNGYKTYNDTSWRRTRGRRERTVTLNETNFEVLDVEHPVFKEGWSRYTYRYTYKNLNKLILWV